MQPKRTREREHTQRARRPRPHGVDGGATIRRAARRLLGGGDALAEAVGDGGLGLRRRARLAVHVREDGADDDAVDHLRALLSCEKEGDGEK